MSTPHNRAQKGDIAQSILLPGDPLRAKYIAENFFKSPVLFNDVRNMLGFTGEYKGKKISVMGTGMGIPSISIYAHELFSVYGVKNAIRVGTCGGFKKGLELGDLLLAEGCSTTSNINNLVFPGSFCPVADFDLLRTAYDKAKEQNKKVWVGSLLSSDMFYSEDNAGNPDIWVKYGTLGVEMEGAGLYTSALRNGARALCMATVSDIPGTTKEMTADEREKTLNGMIELALDVAWEFSE